MRLDVLGLGYLFMTFYPYNQCVASFIADNLFELVEIYYLLMYLLLNTNKGEEMDYHSKLTFASIDVKTSNKNISSICEVGIIEVVEGEIKERHHIRLNPNDSFDPEYSLEPSDLSSLPHFYEKYEFIKEILLKYGCCVSHSTCSRISLLEATKSMGKRIEDLFPSSLIYVDTARIARHELADFWRDGDPNYTLAHLFRKVSCDILRGNDDNSQQRAEVVAKILIYAEDKGCLDIKMWKPLGYRKDSDWGYVNPTYKGKSHIKQTRNAKARGTHSGKKGVLAFTGKLETPKMTEREASDLAERVGITPRHGMRKQDEINWLLKGTKEDTNKIKGAGDIPIIEQEKFNEMVGLAS